ncbi:hypothetical protein GQ457_08G037480 [Hibiscus cannabinus]
MIKRYCWGLFVLFRFYARNDQPGRIKTQQYLEVVLKQLGSQRHRIYQGRVSAQIFQPRPIDKIQKGILISSAYFPQYPYSKRVLERGRIRVKVKDLKAKCIKDYLEYKFSQKSPALLKYLLFNDF